MTTRPVGFAAGLLAAMLSSAFAEAALAPGQLALARDAVSTDSARATKARAGLRAMGSAGLDALLQTHAEELRLGSSLAASGGTLPLGWSLLTRAVDEVAGQKDAYSSRLFWFTDLNAAAREAKRTGKPVLSLRLLGRLDEELSCANSRFFRTALYANRGISERLRRDWILHWESVRPVPVITVDFGDGRTLRRTVTGNSVHLVLAPDGTVVDAIPGLYGPGAFLRELSAAGTAAREALSAATGERARSLRDYHQSRLSEPRQVRGGDSRIDEQSRLLMRAKTRGVFNPDAFAHVVGNFERSMAEDTARNEETFHRKIHEWLMSEPASAGLFTARMYDELFLTPGSDPWLGLAPDAYSALDGEGLVKIPAAELRGSSASADTAGRLTASKMMVEAPLLGAIKKSR